MKIRTKVPVKYNHGVVESKTGIMEGEIDDVSWMNNCDSLGANYTYYNDKGVKLLSDGFIINGEDIDNMYESLKHLIPSTLKFRDSNRLSFYLGFIYVMSSTFGISTDDIEIVE